MTPDLDSEEVRRAFQKWSNSDAWDGDLDPLVRAAREWLRLREQPAPEVRPKWCNVHQHHKWCEHNGGVMGPTGYAAPDVQAQIDAADDWVCPKHGCAVCEECAHARGVAAAVREARENRLATTRATTTDLWVEGYLAACEDIERAALVRGADCELVVTREDATRLTEYQRGYADGQMDLIIARDDLAAQQPAPTIVAELAEKYRAAMSENEHWRTTAKDRISTALADEMVREAVAREREERREGVIEGLEQAYVLAAWHCVNYAGVLGQKFFDAIRAEIERLKAEG